MLSNLASYLGYATPSTKTSQVEKAPSEMRLRAVEEDEWVLIERNENETSTIRKDVDEDEEMTRVTLGTSTCPNSSPTSSKTLSRSSSLDILNSLQESWYLTPPPSFTSEGPVHMETSPLENLLIEHPSMSVYEHTQRVDAPSGKMSNSSPSTAAVSEENHSVILMPIKERMYKHPRNKLNSKLSKKQSQASNTDNSVPTKNESPNDAKEPNIKTFVKSPRRSINAELENLPKKSLRKRPETSQGNGMISKKNTKNDVSQEKVPVVTNMPPRRLYSEVLGSKPAVSAVQTPKPPTTSSPEPEAPKPSLQSVPETPIEETSDQSSTALSEESVMSVEETTEEISERPEDRDRRKVVQTLPDRQNRLHILSRSAQKVEQRKTCDLMKKNPLIRTNKAREFNFRNKRQRRADMMQRHSGANNNRKCAKTSLC